jgi:hypothetical protein
MALGSFAGVVDHSGRQGIPSEEATEGEGTMESEEAQPNWRWTARVGGLAPTRMMVHGKIYGTADLVPLRCKWFAGHYFAPFRAHQVGRRFEWQMWNSTVSRSNASDREYCVDPRTGLLMISSEAAGERVSTEGLECTR